MELRTCTHPGCDGKHVAKGYCAKHYQQWKKYGCTFSVVSREGVGGRVTHHCRICDKPGRTHYCLEHAREGFGECDVESCSEAKRSARNRFCDLHARENRRLRHFYGIGVVEYLRLRDGQEGRCAICREERPLHLDHCHETNAIRGFLCGQCNRGLGLFFNDPEVLVAAAEYLCRE